MSNKESTDEKSFSHPCKDTCSGWMQGYNEGKVSVDVRSQEILMGEIGILRKNNALLTWMLKHGASVYYYEDAYPGRQVTGYYCSYHPHKGPRSTPMEALELAFEEDEKRRQNEK